MERGEKRLKAMEIRGFKSIPYKHPLTLEFGDVNIMLGANGAGKSNVVSFFKMLGQMMGGSLQRFVAESGTNQKFLHYGPKKTPSISAILSFSDGGKTDKYCFSLTKAVPDRLIVASETIESDDEQIQLDTDYNESALIKANENMGRELYKMLSSCKVFQFSDSSVSSPMRQSSAVDSAHYLQSEAANLASFLFYLKNNYRNSYKRISDYVRGVVPQFKEFYLEPERGYISLKWIDNSPNDYVLSADQLSDGSIRFIALATLLLQPADTMPFVIIIDEPELGLHPYAIDQLNEMIKDASLHAQIIIATQSTSIIDGFNPSDITVIERDEITQGTCAKKLEEDDYCAWLNEYSLSELWNKNLLGGRPA